MFRHLTIMKHNRKLNSWSYYKTNFIGAVHKGRPQSGGERVCPVWTLFGQGQMRTSTLFGAKNFGFFETYGVSARTRGMRGWASLQTRGRDQYFAILYGRLLWTVP